MSNKTAPAGSDKAAYQAVSRKDLTYRQWIWKEMKRNWVAYVMIAPYVIIFTLFTVAPVVLSIFFSFTDFNMLQAPNWVWFDNYINLFFADDIFLIACKNTFIFAAIVGPTSYLMSYLVAWFINELSPRIRAVVTLIFYAPSISGQVYLIWGYSVRCRLARLGQRNAFGTGVDQRADRVLPGCKLRDAAVYCGGTLDVSRYCVPVFHRRFAGR